MHIMFGAPNTCLISIMFQASNLISKIIDYIQNRADNISLKDIFFNSYIDNLYFALWRWLLDLYIENEWEIEGRQRKENCVLCLFVSSLFCTKVEDELEFYNYYLWITQNGIQHIEMYVLVYDQVSLLSLTLCLHHVEQQQLIIH